MTDTINKLDVGALLQQLKSIRDVAANAISQDPAAMKDAMSVLMGNLDSMIDQSEPIHGQSVPQASDPSTAIKAEGAKEIGASDTTAASSPSDTTPPKAEKVAAVPATPSTPSTPSTPTTPSTPSTPEPAKKVDGPAASTSPSDTKPKTDDTDAYKAITAQVNQLTEVVNKMAEIIQGKASQPAAGDSPIFALNSLVSKSDHDEEQWPEDFDEADKAIIKALDNPGPYAGILALKAAGVDGVGGVNLAQQKVDIAVAKMSNFTLEKGGWVTASRYQQKLFLPPQ